jgi:hypothetical protein
MAQPVEESLSVLCMASARTSEASSLHASTVHLRCGALLDAER